MLFHGPGVAMGNSESNLSKRNDYFFGWGICAICLGDHAKTVRFMPEVFHNDDWIEGGYQTVHLSCYLDLLRSSAEPPKPQPP